MSYPPTGNRGIFRWPQSLDQIKLTQHEAEVLEEAVVLIRQTMPPDPPSGHYSRVCFRNRMAVPLAGREHPLPRTVYVTHHLALVILNKHGGMRTLKGGAEQSEIKLAWDIDSGDQYVKKTIPLPFEQTFYNWLAHSPDPKPLCFPEVAGTYRSKGKVRVLEKYYPHTLSDWIQQNRKIDLSAITKLQNAFVRLHQFEYVPPALTWNEGPRAPGTTHLGARGPVFHGDISGRNIMCSFPPERRGYVAYRIIDYGATARFSALSWSPGYGSPETLRHHLGLTRMSTTDFNVSYGQKRDTWALGLLIGSLLQGGFHPSFPGAAIPNFEFVAKRLHRGERLNDDGIANLTQREVDQEIRSITSRISNSRTYSTRVKQDLLRHWSVVQAWLKVDPDERELIMHFHIADE